MHQLNIYQVHTATIQKRMRALLSNFHRLPRQIACGRNYTNENVISIVSLGKLNHVAIATPNLEKAVHMYRDIFGAKVSEPVELPEHGVITVFVELDNTKFELLHPLGDHSPIKNFLERNKDGGIHHLCIEVGDIKAAVAHLKSKKVRCLTDEPKIGAHGRPVVFLHPKDCAGVLIELEENKY